MTDPRALALAIAPEAQLADLSEDELIELRRQVRTARLSRAQRHPADFTERT